MDLSMLANLLDFEAVGYEVPTDASSQDTFVRMNRTSDTFLQIPVRRKHLQTVTLVATLPKLDKVLNTEDAIFKELVLERMARVSNVVFDTRFPEIVDFFTATVKGNNLKVPVLVSEYIRGKNLHIAIKSNYLALAKNGDIFDPAKREKAPVNLRRVKDIVCELLSVQQTLYGHGLLHFGVVPEHVILQIDDIVRLRGLRFVVRVKNENLTDMAITDVKKYGPIFIKYYSPNSLLEYIRSGGKQCVNAFEVVAFQTARLIFDLTTKGKYRNAEFTPELIAKAEYHVKTHQVLYVKNVVGNLLKDAQKFTSLNQISTIVESLPEA
ncbi:hypothetical protein [Fervidobacterium thailandense]|uniref:Protein kinase domain-containing protein n=1 Tax=Fervidobacterium thailandense TaxID=1008305 RepID=A0A1E3G3C6_9BACT|nr:hypothetical protein [Fervidobacterium thailandense]ODN30771.1 hypothetical protein A4H02_04390 [Fervidobacterium thailandense]